MLAFHQILLTYYTDSDCALLLNDGFLVVRKAQTKEVVLDMTLA